MGEPVQQLEQQLQRGWRWLRFAPELERPFQAHDQVQRVPARMVLLVTALLLTGTMPLVDRWVLHPPEPFGALSHALQLGLMVPMIALSLLVTLLPRLRRWSVPLGLLTVAVVAGGVIYQRHAGAAAGYLVPAELGSVVIAGTFVLGGLGFWRFLPLALLILAAMTANELLTHGYNSASFYTVHASGMLVVIAGAAGYLQEYLARGTWLRHRLLEELAARDPLTGLLNWRAFEQAYAQLCAIAERQQAPVLVAVIDVDFFKEFNDRYGHAAGDFTLSQVALALKGTLRRASDASARVGGEEFAIACLGLEREPARRVIEDLRASIEALHIPHEGSRLPQRTLTASIGATWFRPGAQQPADAAMRAADARLYESKRAGRNRVTFGEGALPLAASGEAEAEATLLDPA